MYEIDPASVFSSIVSPMTKFDGSQVSDRCPLGYLLLYVRWKSGVTFARRCFRDVSIICIHKR